MQFMQAANLTLTKNDSPMVFFSFILQLNSKQLDQLVNIGSGIDFVKVEQILQSDSPYDITVPFVLLYIFS